MKLFTIIYLINCKISFTIFRDIYFTTYELFLKIYIEHKSEKMSRLSIVQNNKI